MKFYITFAFLMLLSGIMYAQQKNDVPAVNVLIGQLAINHDRAVLVQEAMKYNTEKIDLLSRNKKIDAKVKMDSLQKLIREHNDKLRPLLTQQQMLKLVIYLRTLNSLSALDKDVKEHNEKQHVQNQPAPSATPEPAKKSGKIQ